MIETVKSVMIKGKGAVSDFACSPSLYLSTPVQVSPEGRLRGKKELQNVNIFDKSMTPKCLHRGYFF
jgi:hypothetical protein